jgi:hypothetical protein
MASKFHRVNGRGHRTVSDKARCDECKQVYIKWDFIGKDGKCYQCHGVGEDTASLIKFIAENK